MTTNPHQALLINIVKCHHHPPFATTTGKVIFISLLIHLVSIDKVNRRGTGARPSTQY